MNGTIVPSAARGLLRKAGSGAIRHDRAERTGSGTIAVALCDPAVRLDSWLLRNAVNLGLQAVQRGAPGSRTPSFVRKLSKRPSVGIPVAPLGGNSRRPGQGVDDVAALSRSCRLGGYLLLACAGAVFPRVKRRKPQPKSGLYVRVGVLHHPQHALFHLF